MKVILVNLIMEQVYSLKAMEIVKIILITVFLRITQEPIQDQ